MASRLSPYIALFATNDWLFQSAVHSADAKVAKHRLTPKTNSFEGLAVHLTASRHSLATLLGATLEPLPWGDMGTGFETGFAAKDPYPSLETVLETWKSVSAALQNQLVEASEAVLNQPSPLPMPGNDKATVADFAALNVVHEGYHLGQLGLHIKECTGGGIMTPPKP